MTDDGRDGDRGVWDGRLGRRSADAGGAGDVAEAADRRVPARCVRTAVPVKRSRTIGVAEGELGEFCDVVGDGGEPVGIGQGSDVDAAGREGAAQQAVAGDVGVQPQQRFADAQRVCVRDAVADVIGERSHVGDVVVEPFKFEQNCAQAPARCVGQLQSQGVFNGGAVGERSGRRRCRRRSVRRAGWRRRPARPSKSFSTPRWTNHSRALSLRMVSPTTENRKWPGSMRPAWTGSDRDFVAAVTLDGQERVRARRRKTAAGDRRHAASGTSLWASVRAGPAGAAAGGLPAPMPNRSCISRSNRPAGNDSAAEAR